jgi:hypothetical protein
MNGLDKKWHRACDSIESTMKAIHCDFGANYRVSGMADVEAQPGSLREADSNSTRALPASRTGRIPRVARWLGLAVVMFGGLLLGTASMRGAELMAHWPLDGDGANLARAWDSGWVEGTVLTVPGRIGQALQFDGDPTNLVWVNSSEAFALTSFTLAAWVNVPGPFTPGWQTILEHNRNGNNWYGLWRSGSEIDRFHFRWGTGARSVNFNGTITPGQWYHLACTFGDGVATLYLNGELDRIVTPALAPSYAPTNSPITIGANLADAEGFPGIIDDVRIYDGVLSHQEIGALALITPVPIAITQQPTPVTAMVGTEASLTVEVSGTTPSYQWYKDAATPGDPAAAIPGANRPTLSFDPLQTTDAGDYQVIITNSVSSVTSVVATVIVTADTVPPGIVSVLALGDATRVIIIFDEDVSPGTAENPGHYAITHDTAAVDVLAASLGTDGYSVMLSTAPMQPATRYTLSVSGVTDLAVPPNPANTTRTFTTAAVVGRWELDEPFGGAIATDSSTLRTARSIASKRRCRFPR